MSQNNDFFEKNMTALKLVDPNLFNSINSETNLSCYDRSICAKTGELVPSFSDGKAMYSVYNPQREAENFFPPHQPNETMRFVTVLGLGNGKAIELELQKKQSRILAIETNAASIKQLFFDFDFSNLLQNENFCLCTAQTVCEKLCSFYLPQLHGNFLQLQNRVWVQHNQQVTEKINADIKSALKKISADYSVQAHFGKIWQRNIFENLQILSETKNYAAFDLKNKKYASIIAAGPSLDKSIKNLCKNRGENFIIATDTASLILLRHKITPDVVLTIDGQNISYRHFVEKCQENSTVFINDLCALPAVAKKCVQDKNQVVFTQNSHPFLQIVNEYFEQKKLPLLNFVQTNSGTVTNAAVDFALQCGFEKIILYGADFAYSMGKPYAKASYLDDTFYNNSTRLNNGETAFTALMFRTELTEKAQNVFTNDVLQSYEDSLKNYLENLDFSVKVYKAKEEKIEIFFDNSAKFLQTRRQINCKKTFETVQLDFNFADFKVWFSARLKNADILHDAALQRALLPFAAWCQHKNLYKSGQDSFLVVLELAKKQLLK